MLPSLSSFPLCEIVLCPFTEIQMHPGPTFFYQSNIPLPELSLHPMDPNTNAYELFDACRRGDLPAVQQLIASQPDLANATDMKGFTPLILAAYNEQPEIVSFLLTNGADINAQDAAGNTALMGVCFKGYKDIARKLLDAGADVNVRNSNGAPALTFAATFGHLQIAEWLLQKGADISLRDSRGKSPLDHAVIQENEAMIELLQNNSPIA
jgi:ankyrin repeat protein